MAQSPTPHVDMLRSPLGRARGLGSARAGSKHWWAQRLTAIALVPLTLWFIWSIMHLTGASQADIADWLASPVRLALLLALIAATFHHLQLGMQDSQALDLFQLQPHGIGKRSLLYKLSVEGTCNIP